MQNLTCAFYKIVLWAKPSATLCIIEGFSPYRRPRSRSHRFRDSPVKYSPTSICRKRNIQQLNHIREPFNGNPILANLNTSAFRRFQFQQNSTIRSSVGPLERLPVNCAVQFECEFSIRRTSDFWWHKNNEIKNETLGWFWQLNASTNRCISCNPPKYV